MERFLLKFAPLFYSIVIFVKKNTNEFLSLKHHFDDYATNFNVLDQLIYNDFTIKLPYIRERWRRRTSPLLAIRKHMKVRN